MLQKIPYRVLFAYILLGGLVAYSIVHVVDSIVGAQIHIAQIEAASKIQAAYQEAKGRYHAAEVKAYAPLQILEKQYELQMKFLKAQSEGGPRG